MIKAILATDEKFGIAKDGTIPWHNKEDFKFFYEKTVGKGKNVVVMGKKTAESITSFPLKDRVNKIITHNKNNILRVSYDEIKFLNNIYDDVWIIGGKSIYEQVFKDGLAEKIYISRIEGDFKCDQFIDMELIKEKYTWNNTIGHKTFFVEIWVKK